MAGIYIHIPFCQRRCIYCDFFSTTQSEQKPTYIQALCQELEIRKNYLEDEEIETIYLGGGTPSQLSKEELEATFQTLYHIYKVKEDAEITLEANPDDLTPEYVAMLRTLPINRLSMGIQTLPDAQPGQGSRRPFPARPGRPPRLPELYEARHRADRQSGAEAGDRERIHYAKHR